MKLKNILNEIESNDLAELVDEYDGTEMSITFNNGEVVATIRFKGDKIYLTEPEAVENEDDVDVDLSSVIKKSELKLNNLIDSGSDLTSYLTFKEDLPTN